MNQVMDLIRNKDFRAIFILPTKNLLLQFFRYSFAGVSAFLVDAGILFFLYQLGIHYLTASAVGFVAGMLVNFLVAKRFVFCTCSKCVGRAGEFLIYCLIGLAGLALTEVFMFLFTDVVGFYFMVSKTITASLVFIWNFNARKFILYR